MSSDFDPYYLWLGIPPHEQPPNHYRLLGVAVFESNASVIDSAASRQSTYLHSVATGPQRQASQKLLTEIAAARRTLLNTESKQAYDAELKSRIESAMPKSAAPPVARPVAAPIAVAVPVAVPVAAAVPAAAPIAAPVAAPVAAAVAAPVAAPIASPVAAPVAAAIAAPVAAPVVPVAAPVVPAAVPVAAPVPITVATPIFTPVGVTAPPAEQSPLTDLFGVLEEKPTLEFETPSLDTPVISASPPTPPTASSKPSRPLNPKYLIVGGGAVVLILIVAFVFRPRGNDTSSASRAPKSSTAKKKSSAAAKPKPEPEQDAPLQATPPKGPRRIRFIRIELPRKGVLTLAEVEAWYDGRNVSSYGFAEQKSTEGGAAAALAIDGNPAGNFAANSQSSTTDSDQPWWQLDLGGAYPLEKIVIHNRTDPGMSERLQGFTLLLLDDKRRPLVELKDQPAPAPRSEFVVSTLPAAPLPTRGPAKSKPKSSAK